MGVRRGGRNARGGQRVHAVTERWSAHSAPGVGLLVAAATAPGTFSSSLSARSAIDQGIVTGLASGLHHLLSVSTQDLLEGVGRVVSGGASGAAGQSAIRRWRRTVLVDCAMVPVGLAVTRSLAPRAGEHVLRGAARQLAWRSAVTGLGGALLVAAERGVHTLDARLGAGGRLAAIPRRYPSASLCPTWSNAAVCNRRATRWPSIRLRLCARWSWQPARWAVWPGARTANTCSPTWPAGRCRRCCRGPPRAGGPAGVDAAAGSARGREGGGARRRPGGTVHRCLRGVAPGDAAARGRHRRRRPGDRRRGGDPMGGADGQRRSREPGAVGDAGPGRASARPPLR